MKLSVNLKAFAKEFISPIVEINKEQKAAIFTEKDFIYSVSSFTNNSVYLYNEYVPLVIEESLPRFNVNLGRLLKGLSCVKKDDTFVDLYIKNNNITYSGESVKFNLKLLSDSVMALPKFNINLFKNIPVRGTINIDKSVLMELKKAIDFIPDAVKFYIEKEGDKIYFLIGDKTVDYLDDVRVYVSNNCSGDISENIYDISILKLIQKCNNDIVLKMCDNTVLTLSIKNEFSTLNYLTTQLKK